MRGLRVLFVLMASIVSSAAFADAPMRTLSLMPVPAALEVKPGRLAITAAFSATTSKTRDARLEGGIERMLRRLARRTTLDIIPRVQPAGTSAALVVECDGPGLAVPAVDEDESYTLEVDASSVRLRAPTVVGALRGLETILQLVDSDRQGWFVPAVVVKDQPRFRWRGLLIDVARHWMPSAVIRRNLDAMAAVKLNVLHLHLTDDQGFRIESKKYPRLHQMGSDGHYFTQAEMRDLIAYAGDRGIRVIPEFDIPGHSTSWFVSHPELASAPGPYEIERNWGIVQPVMDPTRETTYKLLDGFLGEMAALFPDAYMHIGGDENEGKQWLANPQIQQFMKAHNLADPHALQAYFNQRLSKILGRHGKRMIGWDEVLHPDLPKDTVIQSWRGQASLAEAARRGYAGILSSGYYIDLMYPASTHYGVDPLPASLQLSADEQARILGGEACMWSEYVDPGTIDSRIWPRLAAIAERFWSPASVTDVSDMYRRMAAIGPLLEAVGTEQETGPAVLLRHLAPPPDTDTLRALVDAIEPVKGYERGSERRHTQFTPLTRVVDAARADSPVARQLLAAVESLIDGAPAFGNAEPVTRVLTGWVALRPRFDRLAAGSPPLEEVVPSALALSDLGVLGQDAVTALVAGGAAQGWAERATAVLAAAAAPHADVEVAVIPAVRLLVAAALERPSLESQTPDAWARAVRARAASMTPKAK